VDNFAVIDIKTGFEMLPYTAIQEAAYEHIYEESLKKNGYELIFDEATHVYKLDGVPIVSVTKVLQNAGLADFTGIPFERLEAARKFGTAVHKACEFRDFGKLDERSLDSNLWPFLDGWGDFVKDYQLTFKEIEKPIASKLYRVAGTPDRIAISDKRRRLAVLLNNEGTYKVTEYKDRTDWQLFLAALSITNWKEKNK